MENIKKLCIFRETLRLQKAMVDMRGGKFAKLFHGFSRLWSEYFDRQAEQYLASIENNPQMFTELKKDASGDFEKENADRLFEIYTLGMLTQEEEIQTQLTVGLSLDMKNENALKYARARSGELIQ